MKTQLRTWSLRLLVLSGGLALVLVIALALNRSSLGSDAPQPIAWDEQACADCHMHIGDPRFAAQIITARGDALSFDDPGCLLRYLTRERPALRAVYFHHTNEDRWLRVPEVGFVEVANTPMGYGLGAVTRDAPGAISYATATSRVNASASARSADAPSAQGGTP